MIKRIFKNLLALATGQGVQVLTQLFLPPAFIAAYGLSGYGEWLVLGAAVGYLTTLDFGLQTYTINRLAMLYQSGEMDEYRRLQSTSLRLTLAVVLSFSLLSSLVFVLPVNALLRVGGSQFEAAMAVFLLANQILSGIVFGNISGIYRVFGSAHRGAMWGNAQKLLLLASTILLIALRCPFWLIALGQLATVLLAIIAAGLDLYRIKPELFPTLRYWERQMVWSILKPSFFFGLLIFDNFLMFQVPILILSRFSGLATVALFATTRTFFMAVRQIMAMVQHAIDPEITIVYGRKDIGRLRELYYANQSIMYVGGLFFGGVAILTHNVLLKLWLGSSFAVDMHLAVLLGLVVMFAVSRDVDFHYQYATNNHISLGKSAFVLYLLMTVAMALTAPKLGALGVALIWLAVEAILTFILHHYSKTVLRESPRLRPLVLYAVLVAGFGLFMALVGFPIILKTGTMGQILIVVCFSLILAIASFLAFEGMSMLKKVVPRLRVGWVQ